MDSASLYTYEGKEPGDLKFNKGDIIILRRKVDENWYHGELNGNHGFFPASYIQCIKPLPQAPPQVRSTGVLGLVGHLPGLPYPTLCEIPCAMNSKADIKLQVKCLIANTANPATSQPPWSCESLQESGLLSEK
uniref:SH3 domain-containing protein n=1 Tax=Malurus cyaneus samueli TaxID=2593467 RepID=A0A8C5TM04_9PASS